MGPSFCHQMSCHWHCYRNLFRGLLRTFIRRLLIVTFKSLLIAGRGRCVMTVGKYFVMCIAKHKCLTAHWTLLDSIYNTVSVTVSAITYGSQDMWLYCVDGATVYSRVTQDNS